MSTQDTKFFNTFSVVIGALIAVTLAILALARSVAARTEVPEVYADPLYVASVDERVKPFAREAVAGRDNSAMKIEAPAGAPSPAELAAVLSVEPTEVNQVFFAGVGVPFCFAQLNSNEVVDRAEINRAAWAAMLSRAWSPHIFFFAGNLQDGGKLYARMWAPALGVEEDPATGSACAALVGVMASKHDFGGTAYRLSIQQGVSMGRRSEIEAEARKSGGVVTSVSVGGATAYVGSGEIEVPSSALVS